MQFWIDRKKLDPTKKITVKELFDAKCIKQVKKGIYLNCKVCVSSMLLFSLSLTKCIKGSQFFNTKIDIEVAEATPEAIEKVEALGGSIKAVFHSPRDLRAIMHPELFAELPTEAQLPSEWTDLKVYLDPFKRGYLAPKEDEKLSDVVKRVMTESSKVPLFKK
jgi:large subunit ribosomal protein L15